ncbi:MAG: DUF72 domain-containing protein [Ignavibacteriae bacterium]|nr:DUF72 domain-containing protein [Ignavibacteriota bacterium]
MNLYIGTSGYSYKEWKGDFYPEDLSDKEFLKFYATKLNSVEINNTFYRLPKESVMKSWSEHVPAEFRFSVKASQKITHIKRLKDVGDETEYLIRTARIMGDRLGVLLFQLPPNMKKDIERLRQFFKLLSGDIKVALEFRNTSWFDDDTYTVLKENNSSLCIADFDEKLEVPFVSTANWGYLRLRREGYTGPDLKKWMKRIHDQKWNSAFVYFKHENTEQSPPTLALKFRSLERKAT